MKKISAEELKKIANVQPLTDEELEKVTAGSGDCTDQYLNDYLDCSDKCTGPNSEEQLQVCLQTLLTKMDTNPGC